jgi:hypothetical protein
MKRPERSWKSKSRNDGSHTGRERLFGKDPGIHCEPLLPGVKKPYAEGNNSTKRILRGG